MTPVQIAKKEFEKRVRAPFAFDRYAGGRAENWCAHFVSWVFLQAGQPLPGYKTPSKSPPRWNPIARVNTMYETLSGLGRIVRTPQPNDLIFYYRNNASFGEKGHVGIVIDVTDDTVTSIEGNLSDRVAKVTHKLSAKNIAGYGRVYNPGFSPLVGLVAVFGSAYITWKMLD